MLFSGSAGSKGVEGRFRQGGLKDRHQVSLGNRGFRYCERPICQPRLIDGNNTVRMYLLISGGGGVGVAGTLNTESKEPYLMQ